MAGQGKRLWFRISAAMVVAVACGVVALAGAMQWLDRPLPPSATSPSIGEVLPPAHPPAELSVAIVHTARSRGALEAFIVGGGSWLRHRQPAQVAVLVNHPQGSFLFDTGLGRHVATQFAVNSWLNRQLFAYQDVDPAVDQLARNGWPADRIRFVLPSH